MPELIQMTMTKDEFNILLYVHALVLAGCMRNTEALVTLGVALDEEYAKPEQFPFHTLADKLIMLDKAINNSRNEG